jgi:hypothetical protein
MEPRDIRDLPVANILGLDAATDDRVQSKSAQIDR